MDKQLLVELLKILNSDQTATTKEVAKQLDISVEMLDEFLRYLTANEYLAKEVDPTCEDIKLLFKMSDPCGIDFNEYSVLTEKALKLIKA
jgi:hypothetical protein